MQRTMQWSLLLLAALLLGVMPEAEARAECTVRVLQCSLACLAEEPTYVPERRVLAGRRDVNLQVDAAAWLGCTLQHTDRPQSTAEYAEPSTVRPVRRVTLRRPAHEYREYTFTASRSSLRLSIRRMAQRFCDSLGGL